MNTKTIIYDSSCPLCAAYTGAFVHTGLLTKEGRQDFTSISPALLDKVDLERAVDEIPLIDQQTHEVWYGIDALLEILQQRIPFAKKIGHYRPVNWLLRRMYRLISYNRRVIVAGSNLPGQFDCTPHYNFKYRLLLMIVLTLLNAWLLLPLHQHVLTGFLPMLRMQTIWMAFVASAGVTITVAALLQKRAAMEFLGQSVVFTTIVLLLSLPLVLINCTMHVSSTLNYFLLGILASIAGKEYLRRMRFAGMMAANKKILLLQILLLIACIWVTLLATL